MAKFPNLVIAGAPKCGSSSLFFWLGAHPQVCASKLKETYFLSDKVIRHNEDFHLKKDGLEAYQKFFEHCQGEQYRLEATPSYIYDEQPRKVLSELPGVKVIFILRKPSERLYSHWRFNRYRMKNVDISFERYLDFENRPVKKWANYLEQTHYINYLERWLQQFGKGQVLVYQFEKMRQDQRGFMKKLASDLNLDPSFYNDFDFFHRNETVAIGSKKLHRLGLKLEPFVPQFLQEKIIPLYLKLNASKAPAITAQEQALKEEVGKRYYESNAKLAAVFPNIDAELWR